MYEATQRKLSAQEENFSQLKTKYEILVKDTSDETNNIKETELVTTRMDSDGKTNDQSKRCT